MKKNQKWTAFILIIICLILLAVIGQNIPGQADLTAEKRYTLSSASRNLADSLTEPVTLNFYFSRSIDSIPIRFKNYATQVEDLLRQYARSSNGNIRLQVHDPRPDTDEETAAIRAGLAGQPLPTGESLFFGLQAIQADSTASIGIFTLEREPFLEYDISQLIYQVQQWEKPVIGIISGLDIEGGMPPQQMQRQMQPPAEWAFLQELRKTYEVRVLSSDDIADDVDVLAVIHPVDISEQQLYAIDQFLLSGKSVLLALDASSTYQRSQQNQQSMMMGMPPAGLSSNLQPLLDAYGIQFSEQEIAADPNLATTITVQRGAPPVPYSAWLTFSQFETNSPLVANLNQVLMPEAGFFTLNEGSSLDWQPILQTTSSSGTLNTQFLSFTMPDQLNRQIQSTGTARTLAAIASGTFNSAFPDGKPQPESTEEAENDEAETPPPAPEPDPSSPHLASGKGTLLLLGDTDFLADNFSVRVMEFFGMRGLTPLNDNLALFANLVDSLAGNPELVQLRGKGSATRPFDRVMAIERSAQEKYQEQLETLETRLSEVQSRISELQQQQQQQQMLIATPETLEAIEEFRLEEASVRTQQREIRKKLREDIERLNRNLALLNLLAMPLFIGISGSIFFWKRQRRR